MAAQSFKRVRTNPTSLLDVLETTMPEMSLSEEENIFLEAVRGGDIRQVKEIFKTKSVPFESHTERSRDAALGSFGLMIAAQQDNYDLVKFLLSQGYSIEEPHPRSCVCDNCEAMGSLQKALSRLNGYRALASPVYLSLSYLVDCENKDPASKHTRISDPVYQAFVLNGKLDRLAREEYEFKKDYTNLSTRCEEYAVALLNLCRNMTEIGCIMSMPFIKGLAHVQVRTANKAAKKLSVLNFAIKNKNEIFVAHPYSQLMLNDVLYQDFDKRWSHRRTVTKLLFVLLYTIFLPLWSFVYLITPHNKLSQKLATPLAKFLSHTCSFIWFLLILMLSSIQDSLGISILVISWIDILTVLWVMGLIFEEFKELYRHGRERYFGQWWNFVALLMLLFFILAGGFWLLGSSALAVDHEWHSLNHIVKSITRDSAFRFMLISNSLDASLRKLFWAMFDKTDLEAFEINSNTFVITQTTGEMLFAIFNIVAILISLNMLIAMMSNSFQQIADDADIQWKFSRTRMWMQYVDKGSVLPPPFNLLPSRKFFSEMFNHLYDWIKFQKRERYDDLDSTESEESEEGVDMVERERILKLLIDRYFFSSRQARERRVLTSALNAFRSSQVDATDGTDSTSPDSGDNKPRTLGWLGRLQPKS